MRIFCLRSFTFYLFFLDIPFSPGTVQNASPDGAMRAVTESTTGAESAAGTVRRRTVDNKMYMWSMCKKCGRVTTPLVPMSEDTWKFSFAKFLEVCSVVRAPSWRLKSTATNVQICLCCCCCCCVWWLLGTGGVFVCRQGELSNAYWPYTKTRSSGKVMMLLLLLAVTKFRVSPPPFLNLFLSSKFWNLGNEHVRFLPIELCRMDFELDVNSYMCRPLLGSFFQCFAHISHKH